MHLFQGCLFHLDQQVDIRVDSVSPKYQIYFPILIKASFLATLSFKSIFIHYPNKVRQGRGIIKVNKTYYIIAEGIMCGLLSMLVN